MPAPRIKPATGLLSRGTIPTSLVDLVISSLPSVHTRESYAKGIRDMYAFAAGRPVTLALLQEWRLAMAATLSTGTVNARLTAARKLIREAQRTKMISLEEATELLQIDGLPFRGSRMGNWLTVPQLRRLLAVPSGKHLRSLRNRCILSILGGTAIRLDELARLEVVTIQQRDGRWVLADMMGKGGRVRTVAVPTWVKQAIDGWTKAAKITEGRLIRQLTLKPEGLSTDGIRGIVQKAAEKIGVKQFSPHDLRRTCARLCREAGGDIEQIQFMLGHADLRTTQRYLGTAQNLRGAVNDNMGL
jgi:integrase